MSASSTGSLLKVLARLIAVRLVLPFFGLLLALSALTLYVRGQSIAAERGAAAREVAAAAARHVAFAREWLQIAADGGGDYVERYFDAGRRSLPYFDVVHQVDAAGRLVRSSPPDPRFPASFDLSNEPFVRDAGPEPILFAPFISPRTGRPTAYLALRQADGSVLAGELNLEWLQSQVQASAAPGTAAFVVDRTGRLLAHPRFDLVQQQQNVGDLAVVRAGRLGPATRLYFSGPRLVQGSVVPVPGTDWVAVSEIDVWTAYGGSLAGLSAILALALALWLGLLRGLRLHLRQEVAAPLERLNQGARALAAGSLTGPAFRQSTRYAFEEVQELAESFTRMDAAIQARQASLEEREAQYRALFEGAPEAILVCEAETGRIVDANPNAERLFGLPRAALLETTLEQLSPERQPDGRRSADAGAAYQAQVLAGGTPRFEWQHRGADGRALVCEVSLARLPAADRALIRVSLIDIAERKRAQAALAESEQRLAAIFREMSSAIVVSALDDDCILEVNDAFVRLSGHPREAALGRTTVELGLISAKDRERLIAELREHGAARGAEWTLRNRSGQVITGLASASAITINGRPCLLTLLTDITDLRRAEAQLRQLSRAVEQNPASIIITDPSGAIEYVNPRFEVVTGYTLAEVRGQNPRLLRSGETPPEVYQQLWETIAAGREWRGEFHNRKKSGELFWESASISAITDAAGRITHYVAVKEDITERKQREREMETLVRFSASLRAAASRAEMLAIILDEVLDLLDVEAAVLIMPDPRGDQLEVVSARGAWSDYAGQRLPLAGSLSERLMHEGLVYWSDRPFTDLTPEQADRFGTMRITAGAPLTVQAQLAGALWVGRRERGLTASEVRLLATIAETAANALMRADLHEQTARRAERLAVLHLIDTAINESQDLQATLRVFLGHLVTQLAVDAAAVLLFDPARQVLNYAAGWGFRTTAIEETLLRLNETAAGRAAMQRQPVRVTDLSADDDSDRLALLGSEAFRAYFALPLVTKGTLKGVLEVFHRQPLDPDRDWLDFLEALGAQAALAIDNARLFEDLQRSNQQLAAAYDATIEGWSRALDLRDRETEGHTQRVTAMTLRLARALGVPEADLEHIRRGALLHDIGKMGVPDRILLKPGPLTDDEWVIMRQHPLLAVDMLGPVEYLRPALEIPYCHHERWDGAGYPSGLRGEAIPRAARIFAVVDVWDALRSDRPYRPRWSRAEAREHIARGAGSHFDPEVARVFLELEADGAFEF